MKKSILFAGICAAFLFFGCKDFKDIEMPETVSVKSKATYELPAGELSFSIKDKLGIDKLQEIIENNSSSASEDGTSTKVAVYDYNPTYDANNPTACESDKFQYIINYPIKEFPIPNNTDTALKPIPFGTPFKIDISKNIKMSEAIDDKNITVPEGKTTSISEACGTELSFYFDITDPDFKTMTLRSGTLTVKIAFTGTELLDKNLDETTPTEGFSMKPKLTLVEKGNHSNIIAESDDETECGGVDGGEIIMHLAGKTLVPKMEMLIDGTISGGKAWITDEDGNEKSPAKSNFYTISSSIDDVKISKITGLNMDLGDAAKVPINQTFDLKSDNAALKSATIKEGTLSFECVLPDGWTGISCKESYFTLSGGITVSDDAKDFEKNYKDPYFLKADSNLAGKTATPGTQVSTAGSYIIIDELKDATVIFSADGDEVTLAGICTIDKIEELNIDLGQIASIKESIDTGINFSTLLSDFLDGDAGDLIKNIKFSGIEGYVFISQPSKNDALTDLSLKGTITSPSYKDSDGNSLSIVNTSSKEYENGGMKMKNSSETLANTAVKDENGGLTIRTDKFFLDHESNRNENLYSGKAEENSMDTLLNAKPESLAFDIDLELSGSTGSIVTLTEDELDLIASNASITISFAIVLPLQIVLDDVTDGDSTDQTITIDDVLSLTGNEFTDDMLSRKSTKDSEDWLDYTPIIKGITLIYTLENTTPLNELSITFDDKLTGINKPMETSSGKHQIEFTKEEIENVCNNWPFTPTIKVEVGGADGKTEKAFARNSAISLDAVLKIQTNGSYIKVWDKND